MSCNLLILGGTTEASALAKVVAGKRIPAIFSYAGRTESPKFQPIPMRVGGFGGSDGLANYLAEHNITHVVDATHPFAAQMSRNAIKACHSTGVPLVALTRPAWRAIDGDNWTHVADIDGAITALAGDAKTVMLALGRLHMDDFAAQPQHTYVLRLVDAPEVPPTLPRHTVIVARGPFKIEGDLELFRGQGVEILVCKNAGGKGASAKLAAAREMGLPVIMIDRPNLPEREAVTKVAAVIDWLEVHALPDDVTERGV